MSVLPIDLLGKRVGDTIGRRLWKLGPCSICGGESFRLLALEPEVAYQERLAAETKMAERLAVA
jgi:hypothetical protein